MGKLATRKAIRKPSERKRALSSTEAALTLVEDAIAMLTTGKDGAVALPTAHHSKVALDKLTKARKQLVAQILLEA